MKVWLLLVFLLSVFILAIGGCYNRTSSNTLVEYRRTGGILGLDDHLKIMRNGETTLFRKSNRFDFVLSISMINELQNLFEETKFANLGKEYFPTRQGADLLEYQVFFDGHTVHAKDSAVPDSLWPILESLNQIIERYSSP